MVRLRVLSHVNHGCYCWKMLLSSVWTESLNTYRFELYESEIMICHTAKVYKATQRARQ